ncbi:hypothetical protein ACVNAN_004904 [Enterobacter hormaechei]|uniref:hypothetical protein n=1 Tax=Enterobacter cloacae complex TaxID=354276 RepID=UPI00044AC5F2|nr:MULTISPECIES: hypothetical protein [Enterobacter cloacae complex]AIE62820.1 hypothetical protein ECNIH2_05395 [Enterobacter cloacae ECNIH2]AKK76437.1 hypothetical protein ABY62_07120 [Enterobacter hormaechei]AKK93779.1 hypothetical protein ABY65_21500 [Enterobacter hormaechei]AKK95079.1 hypothetical protein ABY64_03500 [Enterobacter hormaechei]AKL50448.1 hypothetical protein AB285_03335 [Enterobacter hormaechei]
MTKPVLFDFSNATASEIVSAIDNKITSLVNLRSFRTRVGGSKKADKLYPATREAMNIIKGLRQQAKNAKIIRDILKPYSHELAKGRDVMEIIEPVLSAWRVYYASHGIGLMNEQILLLKMIESGGELEGITGKAIPELTTTE